MIVKVAQRILKLTQTTFVPGRNIMEGAVSMKQYMSFTEEQNGVIFKIGFEKLYDKVKWDFL